MTIAQPTGLGLNAAVGVSINDLMFRNRVTRKQLGEALGITGAGMSKKLLGNAAWTIEDLYAIADFFNVPVETLLPRRVQLPDAENKKTPSQTRGGNPNVVAGAGFEPTTSGL
ncbi:helix-turn-helix domain-containing protein [Corynebacterium aquilae]|uniref:helix-turn-helix domain-containing protein n=1 Tax=Corynebacterium aquilae TaxID=203263 RepID=UPI000952CE36